MESLLDALERGGTFSTAGLAARLGTTPEMIEAKLEAYVRLGVVKKTVFDPSSCHSACGHCPGCNGREKIGRPVTFWERILKPD